MNRRRIKLLCIPANTATYQLRLYQITVFCAKKRGGVQQLYEPLVVYSKNIYTEYLVMSNVIYYFIIVPAELVPFNIFLITNVQ